MIGRIQIFENPLQAHLYLLALDRYLRWRLDDALKALLQDQASDSDAQTNAPPPDAVMEEWLALHGQDPMDLWWLVIPPDLMWSVTVGS